MGSPVRKLMKSKNWIFSSLCVTFKVVSRKSSTSQSPSCQHECENRTNRICSLKPIVSKDLYFYREC